MHITPAAALKGRSWVGRVLLGPAQPWPEGLDLLRLAIHASGPVLLTIEGSTDNGTTWAPHGRPMRELSGGPEPFHMVLPRNGQPFTHYRLSARSQGITAGVQVHATAVAHVQQ